MADRRQLMLYPLVREGALQPGPRKLSCSVGGIEYFADLSENGEIIFENKVFRSPSAFSVYVKRKVNPSRKADDGWTSVKYGSQLLSHYRGVLNELTGGAAVSGGASAATHSAPRTTGKRRRRRRSPASYAEDSISETDDELYSDLRGEYTDEYESAGDVTDHGQDPSYDPIEGEPPRKLLGLPGKATRGRARVCDKHDEVGDEEGVPDEFTFVQCCQCKKWRRLTVPAIAMADWQCAINPDPVYASCAVPQEASDEGIDGMLQDQAQRLHMAKCVRAPIRSCTESEFEADLYAFLEQRGEEQLAQKLRNKQITCNNHPIDIWGLYREVIRHGGFVSNERYDETNRWKGSINFAGEIFPKLRNWTANNRATSVGNQLHCNYRKFLLAYEVAHQTRDLGLAEAPPAAAAPPVFQASAGSRDPLAFLADVASKKEEAAEDHVKVKLGRGTSAKGGVKREADPDFDTAQPRKRRSTRDAVVAQADEANAQQVVAALREAEGGSAAGRHKPGSLLLAADPAEPNRHWAVLVVAMRDLPRTVLAGGICGPRSEVGRFPQLLSEASPAGRAEDAYPVVVMGSEMMGWVERGACRVYTPTNGEAAMAYLAPSIPLGYADGAARLASAAFKALKLASQFMQQQQGSSKAAGRAQGQTAGCVEVGQALADLEARLPPWGSVATGQWQFWQDWRESVLSARTAAKLAPQVLLLAYQLHPDVLKRGAAPILFDELRSLLEMGPVFARGSAAQFQEAAGPDAGAASHGPTVLGISDAVTAMHNSIDWVRWRRNPAGITLHALPTAPPRGRNGFRAEPEDGDGVKPGASLPPKGLSGGSGGSAPHPAGNAARFSGRPSRLRSATPTGAHPQGAGEEHAARTGDNGASAGLPADVAQGPDVHPSEQPKGHLDALMTAAVEGTGSGNAGDGERAAAGAAEHAAHDLEDASATAGRQDPPAAPVLTDSDNDHERLARNPVVHKAEPADMSTGSVDTQGSRPGKGPGRYTPGSTMPPSPQIAASQPPGNP